MIRPKRRDIGRRVIHTEIVHNRQRTGTITALSPDPRMAFVRLIGDPFDRDVWVVELTWKRSRLHEWVRRTFGQHG